MRRSFGKVDALRGRLTAFLLTKSRRSLKSNYGKVKKETGKSPDGGRCHECFVRRRHTCDYIGSNKRNLGAHDFGNHLHRRGFYGMPLVWVSYASGFSLLRVVELVERDNVYSVEEIASQTNCGKRDVLQKIRKALEKRYIEGYLLVDDSRLKLNENVRQKRARMTVKCHNCGAAVEISEADANCPYCGTVVTRKS